MRDFILGGSKITANGDCSHEIKRCLLLGRKAMTNLDIILQAETLPSNKGPSSQRYGFSSSHVWMGELDYMESQAPKNWCFELWCWRLLRVPWTARRSNQSILNEISPEYSLEGLKLKLKLQHIGHLIWRPEFTQAHVHRVSDAIQPSHPLSSPSLPTPNPSQHQSLFQWVNSSHKVAKVLEFQLQLQSFQWIFRTDFL